jgi:transcriptional regulator with XRE-family HTH domain
MTALQPSSPGTLRLGPLIRQYREAAAMPLGQLARLLHLAVAQLADLERNRMGAPSDELLRQIAGWLHCDVLLLQLAARLDQADTTVPSHLARYTVCCYPDGTYYLSDAATGAILHLTSGMQLELGRYWLSEA